MWCFAKMFLFNPFKTLITTCLHTGDFMKKVVFKMGCKFVTAWVYEENMYR